jgi:sarcosine oxidase gamma subunit
VYVPDLIEIAALRGKIAEVAAIAAARGVQLPAFGKVVCAPSYIVLSVRPGRWLLLRAIAGYERGVAGEAAQHGEPRGAAADWQAALRGAGVAVDQSSALAAIQVRTAADRAALAAACRVDLDSRVFREGDAALTVLFQVPAIVAALSSGIVLLTPATTARHFSESLAGLPAPIAFARTSVQSLIRSCGEDVS